MNITTEIKKSFVATIGIFFIACMILFYTTDTKFTDMEVTILLTALSGLVLMNLARDGRK